MSQSLSINPNSISSGIYRSYTGLIIVAGMLLLISVMGFVSYLYNDIYLIKTGILLIILSMALDLAFVKKRILKNKMYLTHHFITMFWAILGFTHAQLIMDYKAGILVYMLLGAFFRRLLKISKDYWPDRKYAHWSIHKLMMFFDFCDPLIIWILWDWIETLSPAHQAFYFGLATVRLIINAKAYPVLRNFGAQILQTSQRIVLALNTPR